MICPSCNTEVHPTVTLLEDGTMKYRCPESECGARLEAPKPTVIAPGVNGGVVVLDPSVGVKPRDAQLSDEVFASPPFAAGKTQPSVEAKPPVTPVAAPAKAAAPVAYDGDIISFMRARLASIESEARKIRAMLKVAEATD